MAKAGEEVGGVGLPVFGDGDQRRVIRSVVWVGNRISKVVGAFYISFISSTSFILIQRGFYIFGQNLQEFGDRVVNVNLGGGLSPRMKFLVGWSGE
jgi:hypothetical protein